jgi:hypothetical protein
MLGISGPKYTCNNKNKTWCCTDALIDKIRALSILGSEKRSALTFDGTGGTNLIVTRYCFNFLHLQELSGEKKFVGLRLLQDLKYSGTE